MGADAQQGNASQGVDLGNDAITEPAGGTVDPRGGNQQNGQQQTPSQFTGQRFGPSAGRQGFMAGTGSSQFGTFPVAEPQAPLPSEVGIRSSELAEDIDYQPGRFGQQVIEQAQPEFREQMQGAMNEAQLRAPSTTNTALASQQQDIATQALEDFNRFQAQTLQEGQRIGLQEFQAQNQAQQAARNLAGELLSQRGQQGFRGQMQARQQALQAAQQAAGLPMQAARLSQQARQQQFVNPTLQMLMQGRQFGQPMPRQPLVDRGGGGLGVGGWLSTIGQTLPFLIQAGQQLFGGNDQGPGGGFIDGPGAGGGGQVPGGYGGGYGGYYY